MERRHWGLLLLLGLVLATFAAADARAGQCGFDAAAGRLTVVGGERLEIRRGGGGTAPTDPILVDGVACGATVTNTDTIAITGQAVTVSLAGGALAPGRSPELGLGLLSSEIEITGTATALTVIGSAAADTLVDGPGGVNLNGAEAFEQDADVNLAGARAVLAGAGGNDTLRGSGDTTLQGGPGSDSLRAAGPGDVADFSDAPGPVRLDLGIEQAVADGHGAVDVLDNVRSVIGGPRGDTLGGTTQADTIVGGAGVDAIAAGAGNDRVLVRDGEQDAVDCGAGADVVVADDATLDSFIGACETIERPPVAAPPAGAPTPAPGGGGGDGGVGTVVPGAPLPDTPLTPAPTATPRPGATPGPRAPRGRLRVAARVQRTGLRRLVRRGLRVNVRCSRSCELLAQLKLSRSERRRTGLPGTIAFIGGEARAGAPARVNVVLADTTRVRRLRRLKATLVLRATAPRQRAIVRRLRIVAKR